VSREAIVSQLGRYGLRAVAREGPHAAIFARGQRSSRASTSSKKDYADAEHPEQGSLSRLNHRLPRPRAVLFDVGLTLIHASGTVLLEEMAADGVDIAGLSSERVTQALILAAEARHVPLPVDRSGTSKVAHQMVHLLGINDPQAAPACLRALGRADIYQDLDHDAVSTLSALSSAHIRLGVISNSAGTVRDDLAAFDLLRFFEVVVDSTEVGAEKPDPLPFRVALEQFGLPGAACWYVGDGLYNDVLGSRAAGYADGVLLDRFSSYRAVPGISRIERLTQLVSLLEAE
jgi:HAD superfamily hydrolase (TIGR01549 family)